MNLSKNKAAAVFGVDRSTLFGWIRRGCPCIEASRPGLPAQLSFKEVLAWRKAHLLRQRWETNESVAEMEKETRERLKSISKEKKICK